MPWLSEREGSIKTIQHLFQWPHDVAMIYWRGMLKTGQTKPISHRTTISIIVGNINTARRRCYPCHCHALEASGHWANWNGHVLAHFPKAAELISGPYRAKKLMLQRWFAQNQKITVRRDRCGMWTYRFLRFNVEYMSQNLWGTTGFCRRYLEQGGIPVPFRKALSNA